MDICTASVSPTGCGHHNITVTVDGVPVVLHVSNSELLEPLSTAELAQFVLLSARRLRQKGVTLTAFVNRITHGDEATNVKSYDLIGPGPGITKTNIGSAYVDIPAGLNGQRSLVDFTGCTQYRLIMSANLIGTGQWGLRVVRDSDNAVLHENANLGAAGQRELDTDWQTLPAQAAGLILVRVQGKSQTAADDPVFYRCLLMVR